MAEVFSLTNKKIWVAGHKGLVGGAVLRRLSSQPCTVLTAAKVELDLRDQARTDKWVAAHRPDLIILSAAEVGGIGANVTFGANFLYDNLAIAQNVVHAAYRHNIPKLVFLGSSCVYPKFAEQPIREEALMTGPLEPTNEAYAIAKIAGLKLCRFYREQYGRDFISLMPCNIYGPGDRWNDSEAHVIPSLISKFHLAKINGNRDVTIWGSGAPLREFLYVDDLAEGILHAAQHYSDGLHLNIGSGREISIRDLAETIKKITGFKGELKFDLSKPDGTPRKILDSSRIRDLGWKPHVELEHGLKNAYADFLSNVIHLTAG